MTTVTQWFVIDVDGQPGKVGWWGVTYAIDSGRNRRYWWDGMLWRFGPREGVTSFGNEYTSGERWRGLAVKPRSVINSK